MVAREEEFQGLKVLKKIFDMPIIKDTLQTEARHLLQLEGIGTSNVITMIWSLGPGILGVKETQQHPSRPHYAVDTLNQRLHQRLRQIVGDTPEHDGIELFSPEDEVLSKELFYIQGNGTILGFAQQGWIGGSQQYIYVIDFVSERSDAVDIVGRGRPQIQDREPFSRMYDFGKFLKTGGVPRHALLR